MLCVLICEALLMSKYNISFYGELEKMMPELSSIILPNYSSGYYSNE